MIPAERVTQAQNAIDGLTALANATTKAGDVNITDAVSTLIDGYGGGGGGIVIESIPVTAETLTIASEKLIGCSAVFIVSDATPRTPSIGGRAGKSAFVFPQFDSRFSCFSQFTNSSGSSWTSNFNASLLSFDASTGAITGEISGSSSFVFVPATYVVYGFK